MKYIYNLYFDGGEWKGEIFLNGKFIERDVFRGFDGKKDIIKYLQKFYHFTDIEIKVKEN